jgi:hypothetical protein
MVDALALRADEGRGTLRKASGSRVQALYPGISEWGNPLEGGNLTQAPLVEHIDQSEGTRGTETS